jgi:hypothetical protein
MKIYKEKAGVISENACWICFHGNYMYSGDTLWLLAKDMWKWWNSDYRLIG